MPDTCRVCGRHYSMYSEGHTPNAMICLKNQLYDLRERIKKLEKDKDVSTTD